MAGLSDRRAQLRQSSIKVAEEAVPETKSRQSKFSRDFMIKKKHQNENFCVTIKHRRGGGGLAPKILPRQDHLVPRHIIAPEGRVIRGKDFSLPERQLVRCCSPNGMLRESFASENNLEGMAPST